MNKVLVIGSPGAGKTTYAKRLAEEMGLPLFHLDHMFWSAGWVEKERDDFKATLFDTLSKPRWIIDGNYISTMEERLKHADTVYFIDVNHWRCTYRIIKRWLLREGDQAKGCPQRVDLAFIKFVFWTFPRRDKKRLRVLLAKYQAQATIHILN